MIFNRYRKKTSSFLLVFLCLALILSSFVAVQPSQAAVDVSLELRINGASVGQNVTASEGQDVTASGMADPNTWVSIKLLDAGDDKIVYFNAVMSDSSGGYSDTFKVPSYTSGDLVLVAGYGYNVATATIEMTSGQEPTEITDSEVFVTDDNKNLAVTGSTPPYVTITVPAEVNGATLTVQDLLNGPTGGRVTTDQLPAITIVTTNTSLDPNPIKVEIPAGTTVSAPADSGWDGTIDLPAVRDNSSVTVTPYDGKTATVQAVIEIGFGDIPLTFDNHAVRILIPGQAGKEVGYSRGGVFTRINNVMTADTQAAGDALPDGGDGKIDVNSDLVVWTKHFTKFATFTQTSTGGNGNGGGDGGGDTRAPTWPGGSALNVTDIKGKGVTLNWSSATDNVAVTGYKIYYKSLMIKDLTLLATVDGSTRTHTVTGLDSGVTYTFKVEAGDAAGNWSTTGPETQATTESFAFNKAFLSTLSSDGKDFMDSGEIGTATVSSLKPTIRLLFTKNVTSDQIWAHNQSCIHLQTSRGSAVNIRVDRCGTGGSDGTEDQKRSIFVTPTTDLVQGESYRIIMDAGLKAKVGETLRVQETVSFTIAGGSTGTAPETSSDKMVEDAIAKAGSTKKVALTAGSGTDTFVLTARQLDLLEDHGTGLALTVEGVTFSLPPEDVELLSAAGTKVQFSARKLSSSESATVAFGAKNAALYRVGGAIFDLSVMSMASDGNKKEITTFSQPIEISLPVPEDYWDEAAQGQLKVGYLNPLTDAWEELAGTYNSSTHTITFITSHLSKYAVLLKQAESTPPPASVSFTDIAGHWAQKDIELMAEKGVAGGVAPDKFDPSSLLTRAQFAAFILRSLGIQESRPEEGHFIDVPSSSWYYGAVETAFANGLVGGYGNGVFKPEANITRQEIASMVTRALAKGGKPVIVANADTILGPFADASRVGPWAREAVAGAVQSGIIAGRDGLLAPKENANRAEAVVMLKRMMELLGRL